MPDEFGPILLVAILSSAVVAAFALLLVAAVKDGERERHVRHTLRR